MKALCRGANVEAAWSIFVVRAKIRRGRLDYRPEALLRNIEYIVPLFSAGNSEAVNVLKPRMLPSLASARRRSRSVIAVKSNTGAGEVEGVETSFTAELG